ncbi:hypothetical protein NBZ79_01895 [Sneathiella marina]|uniref:Chemotaxis protein CheZ n=1 Tax=Sneathiella marina TaxID=2950108 RepID=A0ABY4W3F7_9PROT|nr:hypothetical protein [Sneathiella marina]USG61725.1 hypothetical protein NBZ79_01895 [Sneathiella marina]
MDEVLSTLEEYQARAQGTNVNAVTLLATDYLNHFNEALMLAELVVDMPDMLADFVDWKPKSYVDHFIESGIADRNLAIEAYEYSPSEFKVELNSTIAQLDTEILSLQIVLGDFVLRNELAENSDSIDKSCLSLRNLIDRAGSIINGQSAGDEARVSLMPQSAPACSQHEDDILEQGDIDALFG